MNNKTVDISSFNSGVTGSCIMVTVNLSSRREEKKTRLLVDCGMFQGEDDAIEKNSKFVFSPEEITAVLVTHNHLDHIGRIPQLYQKGFTGSIYASEDTIQLMKPAFNDTLGIFRRDQKDKGKKPLYAEENVSNMFENVKSVEYYQSQKITDEVSVVFLRNAHVPGAAMILIRVGVEEDEIANYLFMGDYAKDCVFQSIPEIPKWILKLPITIITESTYGTTDSNERKKVFWENFEKAIDERKTVLLPVFSFARCQKLLYNLKNAQASGIFSKNIPINLVGPLAQKYCHLYSNALSTVRPDMRDFYPENFSYISSTEATESIGSGMRILLATSGMGSHGAAKEILDILLQRQDALIHFVGYCVPGSKGYEIINGEGKYESKRAEVACTSEFSCHACRNEILDFIKNFENLRLVLINHGEKEVKTEFGQYLAKNLRADIEILGSGYVIRTDRWGYLKSISDKFKY